MKDYYEVLQVSPNAEPEVIGAAYRRLARMYHPDTYAGADATERMREMNEAYEVLGDPARRAEYDRIRGYPSKRGQKPVDLIDNPSYIFDAGFHPTQVQLDGVRLGDPADKIPKEKVLEINPAGARICRGGARYGVAGGRIDSFALADELLKSTGLLREDQIEMRLGKADNIYAIQVKGHVIPVAKTYQFYDKHIEVTVTAARFMIVNISETLSTPPGNWPARRRPR